MKITRRQLRSLIKEELLVTLEGKERAAGVWWQQPKKRELFAKRYIEGENRRSLIRTLESQFFKQGTPDSIIEDYYDEFILPQALYTIDNVWVVRDETIDPRDDPAQAWYSAGKIYRSKLSSSWLPRIIAGLGLSLLTAPFVGALVVGGWTAVDAINWSRYTFGHELAHAIDHSVWLQFGFSWETGYQDINDPYTKTSDPVDDPKYLPHLKDRDDLSPDAGQFSMRSRMGTVSRDILIDLFPCMSPDHPEHRRENSGEPEHAYRPREVLTDIIQSRVRLDREITGRDISQWKRNLPVRAASGVIYTTGGDLLTMLTRCSGDRSDEEIAEILNSIGG